MSANDQSDQALTNDEVKEITSRILSSRKYKGLDLPEDTVLDLINQSAKKARNSRDVEKIVRQKLHNIIAPYLESLNYEAAVLDLQSIPPSDKASIDHFSLRMLESHSSTRERIPILTDFYKKIFSFTGTPGQILDLACGFNPFAIPWMDLPLETTYRAYDMHQPRIDFINGYLTRIDRLPLAEKRDILVNPPKEDADVAFFFKEAHRFEQRQHGCNRAFWESLNVRYLLVSLPAANLTGSRSMLEGQRILVERTLKGLPWIVHEIIFGTEIVFCIDKGR
jgi:16S rRNA (guanine(1405)-N(7))-methyltransferase